MAVSLGDLCVFAKSNARIALLTYMMKASSQKSKNEGKLSIKYIYVPKFQKNIFQEDDFKI